MQHTTKRVVLVIKKGPELSPAPSAQRNKLSLEEECSVLREEYLRRLHDLRVQTARALQTIDINGYIARDAMEWLCR